MTSESSQTWDALERSLWENTPLYNLMCAVVNGELSDFETGYGEPSHVRHMTGSNAPWEDDDESER